MRKIPRSKWYMLVGGLVAALLLAACAPAVTPPEVTPPEVTPPEVTPPEVTTETVKIGFLAPLSGPSAAWGIPGLTGMSIWLDKVNAAGGIEAGNKRYLVEMVKYDTEGIGSKALMGARKMVLEDNVKFIVMMAGEEVRSVQPFVTEHEVITMGFDAFDCSPDRPYFFGVDELYPFYENISVQYQVEQHPEIKRVATTCEDISYWPELKAGTAAICEVLGLDLVYAKPYSYETTDFAPVASALLATEPDLIAPPGNWPENRILITEQLYLQGYEGLFEWAEWDEVLFTRVPPEFMEGSSIPRIASLDEPGLPDYTQEFYAAWMAKFGPGAPEDVGREFYIIDWYYACQAMVWQRGVELAGTVEGAAVREALLGATDLPHILGPANWWGEELYGVNQALTSDQYISEFRSGTKVTVAQYDFLDWWEGVKDIYIKHYTEEGQMWWQKQ